MEQRIKTLEQEVKVLKNQIQKTLLDIQEQILLHYHPALRAEDAPRAGDEASPSEAGRPPESAEAELAEISFPAASPTKVRQVSLADVRQAQNKAGAPSPESAAAGSTAVNHADAFPVLSRWVVNSIAKIGVERTRKLLALRAASDSFPPATYEMLEQLITLYAEDEGAEMSEAADLLQELNRILEADLQ